MQRWLSFHGRHADLRKFRERLVRRGQFYDQIDRTRADLEKLYASDLPEDAKRRRKKELFGALQGSFRELRRKWGGRGLEGWLTTDLTNAHLVSVATYHQHLPVFRNLLTECGGDLDRFFEQVKDLELER